MASHDIVLHVSVLSLAPYRLPNTKYTSECPARRFQPLEGVWDNVDPRKKKYVEVMRGHTLLGVGDLLLSLRFPRS